MRQKDHSTSAIDNSGPSKAARGRRPRRVSPDGMVVVDNLPEHIPVQRREIEAVEMYLGALLDEILGMGR